MGSVVRSGKPRGYNGSTLVRNARYVGLIPTKSTVFPILITPVTLVAVTMDPVQAMCCMVVEHTLCSAYVSA